MNPPERIDPKSPEWRAAMNERRGHPSGAHIADEPNGSGYHVSQAPDDPSLDERMRYLEQQLKEDANREIAVASKPRTDWTLNTGHVIALAVFMFGLTSSSIGLAWSYGQNIDKLANTVQKLSEQNEENRKQIALNFERDGQRTDKYAPLIDGLQRAQNVTDTRIGNIADSIGQLREGMADLAKVVASDHTDIAVQRMQMQNALEKMK